MLKRMVPLVAALIMVLALATAFLMRIKGISAEPYARVHGEQPPEATQESSLRPVWSLNIGHDTAAGSIFSADGYLYVGAGEADGGISKVRLTDGNVMWTQKCSSYQPSYPVTNGKVVIVGKYYDSEIIGLDDLTGKQQWSIPTRAENMSAACFDGK